tara:strand:- start:306 stop:1205 length:900 start_codon:yes stop_codon:yes gene_type:complete
MAVFLTTSANSYYIEQIILEAQEKLILVTPYLSLSKTLTERLIDADNDNIPITIIYGKSELNKKEQAKLDNLNNLELYFCENLHAKCYLNEHSMVITSMNLYEFSEKHNREMGIFVTHADDKEIYQKSLREIDSILSISELKKERICTIKPQEKDLSDIFQLDMADKNGRFWMSSLKRYFIKHYPEAVITKEEDGAFEVRDFPIPTIHLNVNSRIEFLFDNIDICERLKSTAIKEIMQYVTPTGTHIYWKKYGVLINSTKTLNPVETIEGLKEKVLSDFEVIKHFQILIRRYSPSMRGI